MSRKEKQACACYPHYLPSKLDVTTLFFDNLQEQYVQPLRVCLHGSISSTLWHQRPPQINSERWPNYGPVKMFRVSCDRGGAAAVFQCLHTDIQLPALFTGAKNNCPQLAAVPSKQTQRPPIHRQMSTILLGLFHSATGLKVVRS